MSGWLTFDPQQIATPSGRPRRMTPAQAIPTTTAQQPRTQTQPMYAQPLPLQPQTAGPPNLTHQQQPQQQPLHHQQQQQQWQQWQQQPPPRGFQQPAAPLSQQPPQPWQMPPQRIPSPSANGSTAPQAHSQQQQQQQQQQLPVHMRLAELSITRPAAGAGVLPPPPSAANPAQPLGSPTAQTFPAPLHHPVASHIVGHAAQPTGWTALPLSSANGFGGAGSGMASPVPSPEAVLTAAFRPTLPAMTPTAPFSPVALAAHQQQLQQQQQSQSAMAFPTPAQMQAQQAAAAAATHATHEASLLSASSVPLEGNRSIARSSHDRDMADLLHRSASPHTPLSHAPLMPAPAPPQPSRTIEGALSSLAASPGGTILPGDLPLQQQQISYDPMDPTVGSQAEHLSSFCLPNRSSVASASPLPMGALLSPTLHLHPAPPRFQQPLQMCRACGAAINLYCDMQQQPLRSGSTASPTGASEQMQWVCSFCRVAQPFRSRINKSVIRVQAPSADGAGRPAAPPVSTPVELAVKVVEFVRPAVPGATVLPPTVFPASAAPAPSSPNAANGRVQASNVHPRGSGSGLNYAFVLDRHIDKSEASLLRRSLATFVRDELPPEAGLALLSFGATVSVYDLRAKGVAASHVFTGLTGPSVEDLEIYLAQHGAVWPTVHEVRDQFVECLESFEQSCVASEQQKLLMQPRAMGAAAEWVSALVHAGREYDNMQREMMVAAAAATAAANSSSSPSPSASSAAAAAAASYRPSFCFTHAMLLVSGPPDLGPGATTLHSPSLENAHAALYYAELGLRARAANLQFDYCAAGMGHFAAPLVRRLVEPSGGQVFLHKSFGEGPAVVNTSAGSVSGEHSHWESDMRAVLFRSVGYDGSVEVHVGQNVRVTRVVGAVSALSDKPLSPLQRDVAEFGDAGPDGSSAAALRAQERGLRAASDKSAAQSVTHLRMQLSNCRPDSCVSLYYELGDDIPSDYVCLQFVVRYTDWHHQRVTRVVTRRLRVTGQWLTFVKSIDVKAAAVLVVKKLVADAQKGQGQGQGQSAKQSQAAVDQFVRALCMHFGRERVEEAASGSRVYELPSHLNILPLLLYHVRRGPLLGPVVQSSDDIDVARSELLHADRGDALRQALPTLMSFNARGELEELPLETLALQSNRILFLDHHAQIMVWSGSEVVGPAYNSYRAACLERGLAHGRFRLPRAEVLSFSEGSSASRWLMARLVPAHKDAPEWQELTFPQLQQLTPEQRAELQEKLLPTDELSFVEWYHATFRSHKPKQ